MHYDFEYNKVFGELHLFIIHELVLFKQKFTEQFEKIFVSLNYENEREFGLPFNTLSKFFPLSV
jgi:hypothetical protein